MEIGIDSFAIMAWHQSSPTKILNELLERIVLADIVVEKPYTVHVHIP